MSAGISCNLSENSKWCFHKNLFRISLCSNFLFCGSYSSHCRWIVWC